MSEQHRRASGPGLRAFKGSVLRISVILTPRRVNDTETGNQEHLVIMENVS